MLGALLLIRYFLDLKKKNQKTKHNFVLKHYINK